MLRQVDYGIVKRENERENKRKRSDTIKEEADEITGHVDFTNEKPEATLWSQLPYDIISEVANRLETIEDFLAFSLVCKSWLSIYRDKTWLSDTKIPWLMLDVNQNGEHCFSLYKNKILKIPLLKTHDRRMWGSSHGWLVMIGQDYKIQLLNPVTRAKINLPHISTFIKPGNLKVSWFDLVHKATVQKMGNDFLVIIIFGPNYNLAFMKLGEVKWTTVNSWLLFTSVVCYKGKILCLSINGTLAIVETEQNPPVARWLVSRPVWETCPEKIYLAESCDDLLLVCYNSKKIIIYRLDLVSWEWKKMESLGDRVLFLDEHSCSISASSCESNFKKGYIYYSPDHFLGDKRNYYVYDMKSEIKAKISLGGGRRYLGYGCPVWLIPSLRYPKQSSSKISQPSILQLTRGKKI